MCICDIKILLSAVWCALLLVVHLAQLLHKALVSPGTLHARVNAMIQRGFSLSQ